MKKPTKKPTTKKSTKAKTKTEVEILRESLAEGAAIATTLWCNNVNRIIELCDQIEDVELLKELVSDIGLKYACDDGCLTDILTRVYAERARQDAIKQFSEAKAKSE